MPRLLHDPDVYASIRTRIETLPLPKPVLRWAVLNVPWGRGARTREDRHWSWLTAKHLDHHLKQFSS